MLLLLLPFTVEGEAREAQPTTSQDTYYWFEYEPLNYEEYAMKNYGHIPYFVETLRRESGFQSVQSRVIRKDGTREPSYGCAQIHEPSHPDITRKQAMDCIWSVNWAAQQFLAGKASMWTEYRKMVK